MTRRLISVIIPAAGASRRFKQGGRANSGDKIYAKLAGEPLLARVLRTFDQSPAVREIIVAVERGSERKFRQEILSPTRLKKPVILVPGGRTRAESVWNGLRRVSSQSKIVCVHDAARPLIRKTWLPKLMKRMNGCDGIVLGRRVVPTVKLIDPSGRNVQQTLDRTQLFEAQTPQLLKKKSLLSSYRALGKEAFRATDDVSLLEATGGQVRALTHTEPNLKVTTQEDLLVARQLIEHPNRKQTQPVLRFGLGFDGHRLVPRRPFYLGGVRLPFPLGPLGHSDGDALLHAITDGILGAAGIGDIGDWFPDTSRRWKNVRSEVFLRRALDRAASLGLAPEQVDVTVFLDRPKLGPAKQKIESRLAKWLHLPLKQVNVKAKTQEGFGPKEKDPSVSCQALVIMSATQT